MHGLVASVLVASPDCAFISHCCSRRSNCFFSCSSKCCFSSRSCCKKEGGVGAVYCFVVRTWLRRERRLESSERASARVAGGDAVGSGLACLCAVESRSFEWILE